MRGSKVIATLGCTAIIACGLIGGAGPASATAGDRSFVVAVYQDFFNTTPGATTINTWEWRLASTHTRAAFVNEVLASSDFTDNYIGVVFQWYGDRYPFEDEDTAVETAVAAGDLIELELIVITSDDYYTGAGGTNDGFVTRLYGDVLHRAPSAGDLTYWSGQLTGGMTRRNVAKHFVRGSESTSTRVAGVVVSPCASTQVLSFGDITSGAYCLLLKRPADSGGAAYWATQMQGSAAQLTTLWRSLVVSSEYYTNAAARFPGV